MRRKTLSVKIGKVFIGSDHSIKTQSMTTASTMDTDKSVDEAIRIIQAGGKLVRFTAPNINEAKNLLNIKNALVAKGYDDPLVADIHFTPHAALEAAKTGAGKISDRIDQKMQEEFNKIAQVNSKTLLNLLIRDVAMGILPLFALAILPLLL